MGWITRASDARQQAAAGRHEVAARQAATQQSQADAAVLAASQRGEPQPGMPGPGSGWSGKRNEAKREAQRQCDTEGLRAEGWDAEDARRWAVVDDATVAADHGFEDEFDPYPRAADVEAGS